MKEFTVNKNNEGVRLDKFMFKVMPTLKSGEIYMSLRKKKVRVNGKHKDGAYRLCLGDSVCIYMNDECFSSTPTRFSWQHSSCVIDIIYEDENIVIANKPSGMPSQDISSSSDSLESRLRSYLYKKGELDLDTDTPFIPSLCHRIDRNTSGLVIMAKNAPALRIMNQKIKDREVRKLYLCEAEAVPSPPQGVAKGWLKRDSHTKRTVFLENEPSDKTDTTYCKTRYKTLRDTYPVLIEAELLTGRTHQIRATLSHLGASLLGDVKYGAKRDGNSEYQHLISYKIIFDFNSPSGELEYLKGKEITLNTGELL